MAEIRFVQNVDSAHPFAVVYKPQGLASAPLKKGDDCALTQAAELCPQIKSVKGKKPVEYGLLHRIDTETSGLLLIACTQDFYDFMQKEQKEGRFIKHYRATVEGNVSETSKNLAKKFTVTSRFRPFGPKGKLVKPVFEGCSAADRKKCGEKVYSTKVILAGNTAECSITEGYRHQVRAHLASAGFPIKGDALYNPDFKEGEKLEFEAFKIEFMNPATEKHEIYEV